MKRDASPLMADTALAVRPLAGRWNRLGLALHFVGRMEPFASFRAADLVNTLSAQIEREHCLFALDGARVVGYIGWAMYDAAVAEPFARGAAPPPNAQARGRDVTWILTAVATHPAALMALVRTLRAQYPGTRLMGVRHKPGGRRVVFDRAAGCRVAHATADDLHLTPLEPAPRHLDLCNRRSAAAGTLSNDTTVLHFGVDGSFARSGAPAFAAKVNERDEFSTSPDAAALRP